MGRGISRRRHERDGSRKRCCRRCGIEFDVYDSTEPELCEACEEDVAAEEDDTYKNPNQAGEGEFPTLDCIGDWID